MEISLQDGLLMGGFFLLSYLISYLSIPLVKRAAEDNHLFDQPDNNRKLHSRAIPTLGGIAIFFAFLLSFSISPWANSFVGLSYFVAALLILLSIGLKDDLVIISAPTKLISQITAAALVVYGSDMVVNNFYGIFGLGDISLWIAGPVSVFTIVVVINAVNLIDGIDGLAGGIGVLASVLFGSCFFYYGNLPMAMLSFSLAGALLGFLYFNFSPASIFMGDTGSMILGFLLSVQAIEFIGLGSNPDFISYFGNLSPIMAIAILSFPLYDTLRVVLKRIRRKKSIFKPGQDHVHHELLRMGFDHKRASLLLYGKSLLLVALTAIFSMFVDNLNVLLSLLILSNVLIYPTNGFKRRIVAYVFGYQLQTYRTDLWQVKTESFSSNEYAVDEANFQNGSRAKREVEEEYDSIAV